MNKIESEDGGGGKQEIYYFLSILFFIFCWVEFIFQKKTYTQKVNSWLSNKGRKLYIKLSTMLFLYKRTDTQRRNTSGGQDLTLGGIC